jgi:hypothetical protein
MPFLGQRLRGAERELELRAGADQDDRGASPPDSRRTYPPRRRPSRAFSAVPASVGSFWRVSDSADRPDGSSSALDRERPGRGSLVRVAGPDEPQVRDRPQRGVVLDRLVGRAVLAEPDRVVRPDVDDVEPLSAASRTEPRM